MSATATWTFMPLSGKNGEGKFALLDHEDYERVRGYSYSLQARGYVCRRGADGMPTSLHREILGLERGDPREGDHINRDKLDNRRCNLRLVTRNQQTQNLTPRRGTTSRHRGVSWDSERGKWIAKATLNGKQNQLGRFDSEEEAARVVQEWRRVHMPYSAEANSEENR